MQRFVHQIQNRMGLHARVATKIFNFSLEHKTCVIKLMYKNKYVRANRLVDMMNIPAKKGEEIIFEIEGENETEISNKLQSLCNRIL